MEREEFGKALLEGALKAGCGGAEIFSAERKSFSVNALNGEIDRYSVSNTSGVGLRVNVEGNNGYAYTEAPDGPEELVARAMDHARCLENQNEHPMQTHQDYQNVNRPDCPLAHMSKEEKITLALKMERCALAADPRIRRVNGCTVEQTQGNLFIQNTRGLWAKRETGGGFCYVSPVAEDKGETQTGFAFRMGTEAADVEACASEAVMDALSRLGGAPVPSGSYRVVLKNMAMADLLTAFSGVFSAEEAQKGRSLLAGLEGQIVAADCVTITDDPFHPAAPRAFDGEGTPCFPKDIVHQGKLCTLLHNLKTAHKAGVRSTGNALRPSPASTVGVGPSVLIFKEGEASFEEMVRRLDTGLVVEDLEGLHAGLDAVSGDFSLKASGRLIEKGRDVRPVSRITVAGNFFQMLKQVEAVGGDLRFTLPGRAYVACPSVLIPALYVAGD